jgi:hypothetical protein
MRIVDWLRQHLTPGHRAGPGRQTGNAVPAPDASHVGRIAGVDAGYHGETGAERRASGTPAED